MRNILGIAVIFLLLGCGKSRDLGEAEKYVVAFEKDAERLGRPVHADNLAIEFRQNGDAKASCEQNFLQRPTILISPRFWATANETAREVAIRHELGHCVLNRDHLDTMRSNGRPQSIMHTRGIFAVTYEREREHYTQELFSR